LEGLLFHQHGVQFGQQRADIGQRQWIDTPLGLSEMMQNLSPIRKSIVPRTKKGHSTLQSSIKFQPEKHK
jgi:hypothetical protein